MLYLIGLGVCGDITENGLKIVKESDEVYLETYTLPFPEEIVKKIVEKFNPKTADRKTVESDYLVNLAETKNVVLLVGGDPLTATTHIALVDGCISKNVPYRVIHNSSIVTAVGITGLQIYKFGRIVTLVNPRENYKPTSYIEQIEKNLSLGMHTLVLLDTEPKPMDIKTAVNLLKKVNEIDKIVVLSRIGCESQKIVYGKLDNIGSVDVGKPPYAIIIPGKMHVFERECIERFSV